MHTDDQKLGLPSNIHTKPKHASRKTRVSGVMPKRAVKKPSWLIALSLLGLSYQSAHAIDLMAAYESALDTNNNLRSSIATQKSTELQTKATRGQYLPQISGQFSAGKPIGDLPPFSDDDISSDWSINLSQALYNPGLNAQLKLAQINELKGDLQYESAKQQLIYDVAQTYMTVLNAQEQIRATAAQIEFLESQNQTVMAQFDVGLVTSGDVLQVQSQLDQTKAQQSANQSELNTALSDFYRVTGQSEPPAVDPGVSESLPELTPNEMDYWVDRARENNLQIRQSRLDFRSAAAQVDSAKAQSKPSLNLQGSFGGEVNDGFNNDTGQVGINLNIPIFTGGANAANTKAAAYQQESARYSREAVIDQVSQQVRAQFLNIQAQQDQVDALARSIRSSQVTLDTIQAGYEVGTQTIAELLNAASNLRQSQTSYALARQGYLLSLIALKQSVGVLEPKDLQLISQSL